MVITINNDFTPHLYNPIEISYQQATDKDYNRDKTFREIYRTKATEGRIDKNRDIYSSVILRDTVQRYNIREVELLERVIKYAFDNIGNTFSGKNVADYFKSQQRRVDINTVYNYLNALEGAFILYRVPRYEIKGKEILKTQEKFTSVTFHLYMLRWGTGI